jgi:hypothetical protein
MADKNKPQGKQIEGTCITYVKPRDVWAEQGVYVTHNEIHSTTQPTVTPTEPTPERRPFWKR